MKQRLSVLDVRAIANELNAKLKNSYVQNFYSQDQRFLYLKTNKDILLIEPGVRINLCDSYETEISFFCKKLREKCRHTKITNIYQFGYDRIIVIDLLRYKLVVEFFATGNVIILDENDIIVDLLRPVSKLEIVKNTKYIFNEVNINYDCTCILNKDVMEISDSLAKMMPFEKEFLEPIARDIKDINNENNIKEYFDNLKERIENIGNYGEITYKNGKMDLLLCFKSREPKKGTKVFSSFSEAISLYFAPSKKKQKEDKETRIRNAQEKYISELGTQIEINQETALFMAEERTALQEILDIFSKVYSSKMKWSEFRLFYETELKSGNPLALSIKSYDLKNKKCVVNLNGNAVELDLNDNLNKNIERYFQKKKKAQDKCDKTKVALENVMEKIVTRKVKPQKREPFWFEKFHYFITSQGELVLGGRNSQQNEIVVKKFMNDSDLYFHCDIAGASSVISKGRKESTITEAAYMSLAMSKSWDLGVISDVFYVEPEQVSKTAPTGEFISKGSFIIKGKKNFIYPHRLEYGVCLIFIIPDEARDSVGDSIGDVGDQKDHNILEAVSPTGVAYSVSPGVPSAGYYIPKYVDDPKDHNILYGMVMSAPWATIKDFKYKARLTPGNEKKSRLCSDLMNLFCKEATGTPEEDAVKKVGLDEYMGVVPGKSKISKVMK